MPRYSEDDALAADGDPTSPDPAQRAPLVGEGAKQFLAEAGNLEEALFDLTSLFRVPVTNNIPWFEDDDADRPVYHVGEFLEQVRDCFTRAGWTPPASETDDKPAADGDQLPVDEGRTTVPVAYYSAALDEIYRLRAALAYEAGGLVAHLDYKTFPKSRRSVAEQQIDRMRAAARGEVQTAYAGVQSWATKSALQDAGAKQTLTRWHFEAQAGLVETAEKVDS